MFISNYLYNFSISNALSHLSFLLLGIISILGLSSELEDKMQKVKVNNMFFILVWLFCYGYEGTRIRTVTHFDHLTQKREDH